MNAFAPPSLLVNGDSAGRAGPLESLDAAFLLGRRGFGIAIGPGGPGGSRASAAGFDLVAYSPASDEVWLVDHRTAGDAVRVHRAPALTDHLEAGLVAAIRQLRAVRAFPHQSSILRHLREALVAVRTGAPVPAAVRRCVTNALGGQRGVGEPLRAQGVVLLDLSGTPAAQANRPERMPSFLPSEDRLAGPSRAVGEALGRGAWDEALRLALQEGQHDKNALTNLIFFARHPDLPRQPLDPRHPAFSRFRTEWRDILKTLVGPAILAAAANTALQVSGRYVTERDSQFEGAAGKRFRDLVAWAAAEVDLNPGLLAAVLLAEWDQRALYLGTEAVPSFVSGVDDFYAARAALAAEVEAYAKVRFDASRRSSNVNENGRTVTTVPFRSGRDATLATAVYLKYGEIKLRRAAKKNGGDFDALPPETRFALTRIAMTAGHGGIRRDGTLVPFKRTAGGLVAAKPGTGGVFVGVAAFLDQVLRGRDILVRKPDARAYPSTGRITRRNATILAAQALHLSDWIFGLPLATQPSPAPPPAPSTARPEAASGGWSDEACEDAIAATAGESLGEDAGDGSRTLDPELVRLTERIVAPGAAFAEDVPAGWTACFSSAEIDRVRDAYTANTTAAGHDSTDRCSCIVMLNVALGQLLPLRLVPRIARAGSDRQVESADLPTESIERAMEQLRKAGFADRATVIDFFDRRKRTAGTLKPERLKRSVQDAVLVASAGTGCWYAFGLSIMDGYHSVLLLVDHTGTAATIYWLDQFSSGVDDDVTTVLDNRITARTQTWWQAVMDTKGKGYDTMVRLWQLRKPRAASSPS